MARFKVAQWAAIAWIASVVFAHGAPKAPISVDDMTPLTYDNGVWNLEAVEYRISQCDVVQEMTAMVHEEAHKHDSVIQRLFSALFPFGPGLNALLATAYISGPPNLLLALIPPNIAPESLSTLVSFAVGGLLGDVFLHLLPQTFVGEVHDGSARFVLVDEHRNTVLGLAMFVGFLAFVVLDKSMRILSSGSSESGHSHGHSHSHSHSSSTGTEGDSDKSGLRKRGGGSAKEEEVDKKEEKLSSSIKLSAYLNLIADFTHNITDGLAIAASFYISKNVGATTCLAVFFHEIPHEVGDFALLIQGGFTKMQAMQAQFVTAIGAFMGAFIGIGLNHLASGSDAAASAAAAAAGSLQSPGIFGTNVMLGDLTLPFTAGGFLYIATVGVIPEILESGGDLTKTQQIANGFKQLAAMLTGIGIMFLISWTE
ncbi:zinc transporter Yke4p [Trichomonascus vanleenenianus]|uniref:Zn(2+) transporter YKE4 n=1 Tax=Trichomonascus vanleenenianus TaxID=2268995 RepID=UPI003ECB2465